MVRHDRPLNFRIGNELLEAMETLRDRDGVSVSEQVRIGVRMLLAERKVPPSTRKAPREKTPAAGGRADRFTQPASASKFVKPTTKPRKK